jgi:hypothetical protein
MTTHDTPALIATGYEQLVRRAVRSKRCYDCGGFIEAGNLYLAYTATPRHDMNTTGKWLHVAFCRGCSKDAPQWDSLP